jgi:PilZ domain
MMEHQQDQRTANRSLPWGTLVFYRSETDPEAGEHLATVEDIGPSGLFIAMREPPAVGAVLRLKLYSQAAPAGATLTARAVVRWRRLGMPKGAGVQLLEDTESTGFDLKHWIASLVPFRPLLRDSPAPNYAE